MGREGVDAGRGGGAEEDSMLSRLHTTTTMTRNLNSREQPGETSLTMTMLCICIP